MSTKNSLAHGPNFHLYREAFDENNVYLELEGTQFEASYNRVLLPIPIHIWELIRCYPSIDFEHADKTDVELSQHVEREVDERLKHYQEASEKAKTLVSLFGSLVFGSIDQPREEQIAAGIAYFTKTRSHQRQIQRAIAELEQLNR